MVSRDMNFIMLPYSKLQFREKHMPSLVMQKQYSASCVFSTLDLWNSPRQNVEWGY